MAKIIKVEPRYVSAVDVFCAVLDEFNDIDIDAKRLADVLCNIPQYYLAEDEEE